MGESIDTVWLVLRGTLSTQQQENLMVCRGVSLNDIKEYLMHFIKYF